MREPRSLRQYSPEFKADAVDLLMRSDAPLKATAERLGVNHWTLRDWYRNAMKPSPPPEPTRKQTPQERLAQLEAENKQLRKRVADLETDRAILKKAAVFFAREGE
jgi:transposase